MFFYKVITSTGTELILESFFRSFFMSIFNSVSDFLIVMKINRMS